MKRIASCVISVTERDMYVRTYVRTVRSRVFTCVHVKHRQLHVQVPNFEFVTVLDLLFPSCRLFFFRSYLFKTNRGENEGHLLYDGAQITPGRTRSTLLYRFEHLVVNCLRSSTQCLSVDKHLVKSLEEWIGAIPNVLPVSIRESLMSASGVYQSTKRLFGKPCQ